jgi:hypothetical protein
MDKKPIFVFGSNLAGRHGKGAAKDAILKHGAIYGQGIGPQGRAYAIPTKDENLQVLPIFRIKEYVTEFLEYAKAHPEEEFYVTKVGCGLANYSEDTMAPLFWGAPPNCSLPDGWRAYVFNQAIGA